MQHFSRLFIHGFAVKWVHFFVTYEVGNFLLHGNSRAGNDNCVQNMMAVVFRAYFAQAPETAQQVGNLSVGGEYASFSIVHQPHMAGDKFAQKTVDIARIVQIAFFKFSFIEFLQ